MLKFKQAERKGNILIYNYSPECTGAPGIVSINTESGDIEIIESSKDDFGNRYANKLVNRLTEFFKNKEYKRAGVIAWY